jgi:hypothetical protein
MDNNQLEIRGFLHLDSHIRKIQGKMPLIMNIDKPVSGIELANLLLIDIDEVEVIFVNGFVQSLDHIINPGDRVAFLPPGCPGPYRIALGFYGKNDGKESARKIANKDKG